MKKFTLIVISLFAICLAIYFSPKILPGQQWRVPGEHYRRMVGETRDFRFTYHSKASQPQNFTPAMSNKTYSDTVYFHVYENYIGERVKGGSTLPYPPVEVYCVKGQFFSTQSIFFFVARHSDGVHSAWVVHTATGAWNTHKIFVDEIGCAKE